MKRLHPRGRSRRKTRVRELLENRDFRTLLDEPNVSASLVSMLFDTTPLIRWRSVDALGEITGLWAERDIERVREILRRLIWSMNDESGGLIWMAPEAASWILVKVPRLAEEFTGVLLSKCRLEPFIGGMRWVSYHLAAVRPDLIQPWVEKLAPSLESQDEIERTFTAATLIRMKTSGYEKQLGSLQGDTGKLDVYDFVSGRLDSTTVGEFLKSVSG